MFVNNEIVFNRQFLLKLILVDELNKYFYF